MHILFNTSEIFLITLLFISVMSIWPMSAFRFFFPPSERNFLLQDLTFALVISFAVLDLAMFGLGYIGKDLQLILRIAFYSVGLVALQWTIKHRHNLMRMTKLLVTSALIGLWNFLPAFYVQFQSGASMGMITKGNNDIGYYVDAAAAYMRSGFVDDHHVAATGLNQMVRNSPYFSPDAFIAFIASAFHRQAWEVAMPAATIGLAFSALALGRLAQVMFPRLTINNSMVLGAIVIFTPIIAYISDQYFLGQIYAIAISVLITANMVDYFWKGQRSRRLLVESALLVILAIFAYPVFLVPFLFVTLAIILSAQVLESRKFYLPGFISYLGSLAIGGSMCFAYIPYALAMSKNLEKGTFGWPFPPLNPIAIFLTPQLIGFASPKYFTIISWLITLFILVFLLKKSEIEPRTKMRLLFYVMGMCVFVLTYIQYKGEGYGAYHSWKLISYVLPLVYIPILALIILGHEHGRQIVSGLMGITLFISISIWGLTKDTVEYTSRDMQQLEYNPILQRVSNLNINLKPNFETMAAVGIIRHPTLHLNSQSYLNMSTDKSACTLVRLDDQRFSGAVPLNGTYGLLSGTNSDCDVAPVLIELNQPLFLDSLHARQLWAGWSQPEKWGTWSNGRYAEIYSKLANWSGGTVKLELNTRAFLAQNHPKIHVELLANGLSLGTFSFTMKQNGPKLSAIIPAKILTESQGRLKIGIVISDPASPLALGISQDSRLLGLGVSSIVFLQNPKLG